MALLAGLGVLGAAAYYLTNYQVMDLDPGEKRVPTVLQTPLSTEFLKSGIVIGTLRPFYATVTSLNEAWKPYSAPEQTPTNNVGDVFHNFAVNIGYEESNAPAFFFKNPMAQISLASSEQSNPNLMLPVGWDTPKHSSGLGNYPRAYKEYENQDLFQETHSGRWTSYGYNTDAGMPTETEVHHVPPDAGSIVADYNPWGPGGLLQNLFANGLASRTKQKGTNLSTIIGPPANASRSIPFASKKS